MSKRGWLPYARWYSDRWYKEMMGIGREAMATYMLLASCARNNDGQPGMMSATMGLVSAMAWTTVETAWRNLLELVRAGADRENAVGVQVSRDGGVTWVEVSRTGGANPENDQTPAGWDLVKISFTWIRAEETAIEAVRSADRERKRQSKQPAAPVEVHAKPLEQAHIPKESTGIQRNPADSSIEYSRVEESRVDIPPNPPAGGNGVKRDYQEPFERWWKTYPSSPRKADKAKCLAKFQTLAEQGVDPEAMIEALRRRLQDDPGWARLKGKFVEAPKVWLNQRRWEAYADGQAGPDNEEPPEGKPARKVGCSSKGWDA